MAKSSAGGGISTTKSGTIRSSGMSKTSKSKSPPTDLIVAKEAALKKKSSGSDSRSTDGYIMNDEGRQTYISHSNFLFSIIASIIGFGNVWRFPDLIYNNGGSAFIIPYFLSLILFGLPMVNLELFLGQLSNVGVGMIFGLMVPIFQGIGLGMVVSCVFISFRYTILIAYSLLYFVMCFQTTLMWSSCRNGYNTNACRSQLDDIYCQQKWDNVNATFVNLTCITNDTDVENADMKEYLLSPAHEFFEFFVLQNGSAFMSWKLALSLLVSWLLTFLCMLRGISFAGKIAYFTLPYFTVCFIVLFFATVSQGGADDGVKFYFIPKFDQLSVLKVWRDASMQVFLSLDIAVGTVTNTASYNLLHKNCHRDAYIVVLVDTVISLFAGFVIFAGVGNLSKSLDIDINDILKSGYELAFVIYPYTLALMPVGQFWSFLFFSSLVLLGLCTQVWILQVVLTEVSDVYIQFRQGKHRIILIGLVCATCFLIGLAFCTKDGVVMLTSLDDHENGWPIALFALLEVVTVCYIYGIHRFTKDVKFILDYKPNYYLMITWTVISPICILMLLIILIHEENYHDREINASADFIGWFVALVPILCVPCFAVFRIIQTCRKKMTFKSLFVPHTKWCPRRRADMKALREEIAAAEKGQMGEFELSPRNTKRIMLGSSPKKFKSYAAKDHLYTSRF